MNTTHLAKVWTKTSKRTLYYMLLTFTLLLDSSWGFSASLRPSDRARESRKLFGGYRITPRFCRPTRGGEPSTTNTSTPHGPSICMFNHECTNRGGKVVGACMDGFLFGACCQFTATPGNSSIEDLINAAESGTNSIIPEPASKPNSSRPGIITLSDRFGAANASSAAIPTADDNSVVQLSSTGPEDAGFVKPSTPKPLDPADTVLYHENGTKVQQGINLDEFNVDRSSTMPLESSTKPYYYYGSNYNNYYGHKPDTDKYVLVPTITNEMHKNKTDNSIVNIIQMLDESTPHKVIVNSQDSTSKTDVYTTRKPPSTSYLYSPHPTHRPGYVPSTSTSRPLSTSYVSGSTAHLTRPRPTVSGSNIKHPSSTANSVYSSYSTPTTKPNMVFVSSSTQRPNTYDVTTLSSRKPPSTSYVYSPSPTKRPIIEKFPVNSINYGSTTNKYGATDKYTTSNKYPITKKPIYDVSQHYSTGQYSDPPTPTVIMLGHLDHTSTTPSYSNIPNARPTQKPVSHVTINNMISATNTIQFGQPNDNKVTESTERPVPTILITPKPTPPSYGTQRPIIKVQMTTSTNTPSAPIPSGTSADDLNNFPPVRNPNLNMSASVENMNNIEFTTPAFIEDEVFDKKVENFVNKIIQGLQDPFHELKDLVMDNKTIKTTTTKKPPTKKPVTTRRPVTKRPTTKRPTTTTVTTRRPIRTTTKRATRKPTTTTVSYIEEDEYIEESEEQLDYTRHCGVRPLMRSGKIVGGKGATFGAWPWQVLVRESTWLGLFTKNKCGGVLISPKYVMTAAHCQPGFLASLVAVFGEFDISGELESKRNIVRPVHRVIVHRQYDAATFENDLALLELETPVQYDEHIVPICLPSDSADFTGRVATVTGWGRLKYGGGVPSVLQEVQVPVMENHVCQEMFRTAGHSKIIRDSFLCAGYANGQKDSCEGDSGGPLVVQRADGRWELAGTVSHGIKCAAPYLPGVYMRTTFYKPWLSTITGVH